MADIARTLRGLIEDILKGEPQALATVKRLVLAARTTDDAALLDDAAESLVALLRRPEASDGIKAFKAKTSPPWAKG
jgi:isohexenylglutaconyl-CoA hydratase